MSGVRTPAFLPYRAPLRAQALPGDAALWRTAKNGKKYQIDTATGEIVTGNLGQRKGSSYRSRPLESVAPDTARYNALLKEQEGNAKKAAHEYFREKLQGRYVEAHTNEGTIQATFTGGSWSEIKKDISNDPLKAELVPHMPDIITTGQYSVEIPAHDHPDVMRFHTYRKTVRTSAGPKEAIVDVAERMERKPSQPEHQVYSLAREGAHAYEKRQKESAPLPGPPGRNRGGRSAPTQDSDAVDNTTISPRHEVVNLRYAEAVIDEAALIAEIKANIIEALRRERRTALAQGLAFESRAPRLFSIPRCGPFAGLSRLSTPDREGLS